MSNLPKFHKSSNLGEFVVLEKQLKPMKNRNANYLQLIVKNEFSTYRVYCFENPEYYNKEINLKDKISIKGYYDNFNGYENIKAVKITKEVNIEPYLEKLNDLVSNICWDDDCERVVKMFIEDDEFMEKFVNSPASLYSHHSYKGGLLVHTVTSMEIGLKFSELEAYQDKIDLEILLTGLFLHDIGKIYSYDDGKLTEYEKMIGHIVMGEKLFEKFLKEKEIIISNDTYLHLNHIILTHHTPPINGNYGLKPLTNEAKLVNRIESLDAEFDELNLKIA